MLVDLSDQYYQYCISGDYCERTIDQCRSVPCGINGTCVAYTNGTDVGYRCTACAAGYKVSDNQLKCVGSYHFIAS